MKEEYKGLETKHEPTYTVFNTTTGTYLPEPLCQKYNIGDKNRFKLIKNVLCYKVTQSDLDQIKQNEHVELKYEMVFDLQLVLSFTVYVDKKHDNKLYIINNTCEKFKIKPISKRIIEGSTYCNVTEEDINMIEEMTKDDKILLKKNLVEIELEDEVKPAEYLFIYYYNVEDKKIYVQRNVLELAKQNDLAIEASPKIIDNKNCYSITEEQLKELERKTNYRGVEKIIKPKLLLKIVNNGLTNNATFIPTGENKIVPIHEPTTKEDANYEKVEAFKEPRNDVKIKIYRDIHSKRLFSNIHTVTRFNIEFNEAEKVIINNEDCYEITREDALFIINNENNAYSPYEVQEHELPLGLLEETVSTKKVTLYKDINSRRTFADENVIERFTLDDTTYTVEINGKTCHEIKQSDEVFIIEAADNKYSPYNVDIKEMPLGIEDVIPYNDNVSIINNNGEFKNNDVLASTHNENTVSSVNEEVAPYEDRSNIINEQIIPASNQETVAPYTSLGIDIPTPTEETKNIEETEKKEEPKTDIVLNENVTKLDVTAKYLDANDNIVSTNSSTQREKIVIYKDTTTGKLYVPQECTFTPETPTKKIMNKDCYETSEEELERIFNKVFVITDVFPAEKSTLDVVICNNDNKLYVSKSALNALNFYIENPHRIKVNKEIFEEITADDVDLIKERETEELAINIIFKHISPTKKRG